MDLVDENQRLSLPLNFAEVRAFAEFADLLGAGFDRVQIDEIGSGFLRQHAREGGFAAAGRTPEDDVGQAVRVFQERAQRFENLRLTAKVGQLAGAEPLGEGAFGRRSGGFEEIHWGRSSGVEKCWQEVVVNR